MGRKLGNIFIFLCLCCVFLVIFWPSLSKKDISHTYIAKIYDYDGNNFFVSDETTAELHGERKCGYSKNVEIYGELTFSIDGIEYTIEFMSPGYKSRVPNLYGGPMLFGARISGDYIFLGKYQVSNIYYNRKMNVVILPLKEKDNVTIFVLVESETDLENELDSSLEDILSNWVA